MRYIRTTAQRAEELRKHAKHLKRNGGGKHTDLLDRVARTAGYDHWHHVKLCLQQTEQEDLASTLMDEVRVVQAAEEAGEVRFIVTGPEKGLAQQFLLFSTGVGDAWLLEPAAGRGRCLTWRGENQVSWIRDLARHVEILWDGEFELREQFFVARTGNALIGSRMILGYPLDRLRDFLERLKPQVAREAEVFGQEDTVPLTEDVLRRLETSG
jgi:hypothetical protein